MRDTLALLLADGYKHVHAEQYPKGTELLVSYLTPRKSRLKTQDHMVFFGLQAFCKHYLIDYFKENFFDLPLGDVIHEYTHVVDTMLGKGNYDLRKIIELHKLGYLPIEIWAVPEGTLVPMKVPCIEIHNTHKDFAWVTQWVESLMSAELWKICVHAGVGLSYRQIVDKYYDMTVDDAVPHHKAISDFGFRGMSCREEAQKASAAWLLSFSGTATVPAIPFLERYYNCDCSKELVGTNAISTEHSVMAAAFAVDGDERTGVKRLLTEVYPHASFSMVSDTYDYWNMVDVIIPSLKQEILNHDGKLLIRPDSGDIIEISVKTIQHLWDTFGGHVNSKGYKVLDPHIGCVYGDGVTQLRAEMIYRKLAELGFAASNIVFGAGSFSFNCIQEQQEDGSYTFGGYTRDTFCVAVKATAGVINGKYIPIFKDPKTDKVDGQNFKKSQKGFCHVFRGEDGELTCKDEFKTFQHEGGTLGVHPNIDAMRLVYSNGTMNTPQTLHEIRYRLHKGNF